MRPDMQACTKGRYRPGKGWKSFQKFADKFDHTSVEYLDDVPELSDKVGSKTRRKGWREKATIHIAPLFRYLQSREGKDWDETYSQLRKIDFSGISHWLGRNFAEHYVAMPGRCYKENGEIYMTEEFYRGWSLWYVDPDTNFLQPWPKNRRTLPYYKAPKSKEPLWYVLDKKKRIYLVRHKQSKIWYKLQLLKERPEPVSHFWWERPSYGTYMDVCAWHYYREENGNVIRYRLPINRGIHAFEGIESLFTKTGTIYYRPWQQASKEEIESIFNPRPIRARKRQRYVRDCRTRRS